MDGPDGRTRVRRDWRSTLATLKLAQPGQRWHNVATSQCSWQAVVCKACNTAVSGKEYLMDWSYQESCPCRPLSARSLALVLTFMLAPFCNVGELCE